MDLTPFQRAWPQLRGGQTQPLAGGTNAILYRVQTSTGAYALRLVGAQVTPRRLRFEYDILTRLDAEGLPFALPTPLLTAQGDSFARIALAGELAGETAGETLVTLSQLIPGQRPQRDDLAQAEGAGEALGLLDEMLARITPALPDDALTWRSTGDLTHCHPFAPEPRAAIGALPLPAEALARLLADYDALLRQCAPIYAGLPRQLSHEDVGPGNVLVLGARVMGILDWEFCALDLRPMDLVVALSWWPVERFGSGDEWPIIAALLRGYARHRTLDAAEIAAMPTLFRLRAYSSLIHRLGRQRQGLSPMAHVILRAEAALAGEDWLQANSERLIQLVDEALR